MTTFFAQPYDISATGFYLDSFDDYQAKARASQNDYGQPIEEFEIHFIDGDDLDAAFADAFGINQANIARFINLADEWGDDEKTRFIIAVGECGYDRDCDPDRLDIDLYEIDSLTELARQFVDEGLFGDIPDRIACYLDYDLIARDLACDYSETTVSGRRIVYRCG
ncbi:MAG: antirestriction protein ArdA [Proteobacteria bacterium]|nr:antirestriction protein ArdA [Pseudomonadota bacterium]